MRWCLCKSHSEVSTVCYRNGEFRRKVLQIQQKEKDLIEKEKNIQKKLLKLKEESDRKARKELFAAAELKKAQSKLLKTLDRKDKIRKRNCSRDKKKHDKSRKKAKSKKHVVDIVHNFFDSVFKMDKNVNRLAKVNSQILIDRFKRILLQPPIACNTCKCESRRGKWNAASGDCYLMSLRKTPQLCIYQRWPQFYPQYLDMRAQCRNCGILVMFLLGFIFWIPCFLCLEICKCFFCLCCSDY